MNRIVIALGVAAIPLFACVIKEAPPANSGPPAAAAAPPPDPNAAATPAPTAAPAPTPAPTGVATPTPVATGTPTGMPTGFPTGMPTGFPTGGTPTGTPPAGGLTLPGVCIPVGTWTKKFDNGIPSSGTVQISAPVIFNQFPVADGVVVAGMPAGSLKGTGAMTSTNDLSIDVSNAGYVVSYTCKFGSDCKTGVCTVTKGSLGSFKLNKS